MTIRTLATSALLIAALAPRSAAAQCPSAADGFDLGGVAGDVDDIGTFDLGNGGELFACGSFEIAAGGVVVHNVARWDGSAWRALGDGLRHADGSPARAHRMIAFDDGGGRRIFVAGDFDRAGDVAVANVAAWDGQSWSAAGGLLAGSITSFTTWDDGAGVALFAATNQLDGTNHIVEWTGSGWTTAAVVDGTVWDLASFDDGAGRSLWLAGDFALPTRCIARWDGTTLHGVDGGLTRMAAPSLSPTALDLVVWDDGTGRALYVAGQFFDHAGQVPVSGVARRRAGAWSAVGTTLTAAARLGHHDFGAGERLVAVSNPLVSGPSTKLWSWNGVAWGPEAVTTPAWGGFPGVLTSLDRGNGRELVAGGSLLLDGSRSVASWDGQAWRGFGAAQGGMGAAPVDLVAADIGNGTRLHALSDFGGLFEQWSSSRAGTWDGTAWQALPTLSALATRTLAALDRGTGRTLVVGDASRLYELVGGTWSEWAIVGGFDVHVLHALDLGAGETLFVGGQFGAIGDAAAPVSTANVAGWRNGAWFALGSGLPGRVKALGAFDAGSGPELHAGGAFFLATTATVARWDGVAWQPLGAGTDRPVTAMAVFDDGTGPALYVGGDFTTAGGIASPHVARWDGQAWSAVGAGLATDHPTSETAVTDMVVFDDGSGPALYVGGDFHTAGGTPAAHVARWDGTAWTALGTGASAPVTALTALDGGTGDELWIAGEFVAFDGVPSSHIARWGDRCASEASVAFCTATDAVCPCGNGGDGTGGCDTPQATGGVRLELASLVPGAGTSEVATLRGTGFPTTTSPAVLLLRAGDWAREHVPFGDGLACLGGPGVVDDVSIASAGTTTHVVTGQDGTGVRYYQLRYRSNPAAFCDATAAFNTSNAFKVTW